MSNSIFIPGPFGQYTWGTMGGLMNAITEHENVPITMVENMTFSHDTIYSSVKQEVGRYKWYNRISTPLVIWLGSYKDYNKALLVQNKDGTRGYQFRLSLCSHGTPALQVYDEQTTPELHKFLLEMMTNYMNDPRYKLNKDSGAFFQSGSDNPKSQYFLIEFWKPDGTQAFVDYVNNNYKIKKLKSLKDLQLR